MVRVACTTDKENLHRAVKLEASEENRIVHESLYWKDSASGSVTNLVLTATGDQAQTDCKEKHTCIISYMQCFSILQECIPVGCVPPALYRIRGGGLCPGRSLSRGGPLSKRSMSRGVSVRVVFVQGYLSIGSLSRGSLSRETPSSLWTEWLTDRCKHYLPATSFAGGKNNFCHTNICCRLPLKL